MTAFERFERDLPELMAELASARVPDYFDDMLRQTARTRQRPAWSSLERWLPMGVSARPAFAPQLPWRSILIFVVLGLLVAAGAVALVGSRLQRVPDPFGPARNGSILYSTSAGDILAVDPATGADRTVVGGASIDSAPWLSHDGQRFSFLRNVTDNRNALFVANVDGSATHRLLEGSIGWFEWSPNDRQAVVIVDAGTVGTMSIVDADDASSHSLELGMDVEYAFWRPNGHQLVFHGQSIGPGPTTNGLYVVDADGSGLRPILPPTASDGDWMSAKLSPDGKSVVYVRWADPGEPGRIHVVDIDTGVDRRISFDGITADENDLNARFSPDGTKLLFERYAADPSGYRLVLVNAAGGGPAVAIGPRMGDATNGSDADFSPDGKQILVTYHQDETTWLLDLAGGVDQKVPWSATATSWQRLAP